MTGEERRKRASREHLYETRVYLSLQRRLANNLRAIRRSHGWTQEEAAAACGLVPRVWQRLERGEGNVSLVTLARLVDGLKVDIAALFASQRSKTTDG